MASVRQPIPSGPTSTFEPSKRVNFCTSPDWATPTGGDPEAEAVNGITPTGEADKERSGKGQTTHGTSRHQERCGDLGVRAQGQGVLGGGRSRVPPVDVTDRSGPSEKVVGDNARLMGPQ